LAAAGGPAAGPGGGGVGKASEEQEARLRDGLARREEDLARRAGVLKLGPDSPSGLVGQARDPGAPRIARACLVARASAPVA